VFREWQEQMADQITTGGIRIRSFLACSRQLGGPLDRNCAPSCASIYGKLRGVPPRPELSVESFDGSREPVVLL